MNTLSLPNFNFIKCKYSGNFNHSQIKMTKTRCVCMFQLNLLEVSYMIYLKCL